MKPTLLFAAFLTLAATSWSAAAATDRSYYVTELAPQQKFDVYNDGRNTYLESIPGLVVTGATADGERYIVNGVPSQIKGFMNGKPITVVRGTPPAPAAPDPAVVNARIKQLTEKIDALASKTPAAPVAASAHTVAPVSAATAAPGVRTAGHVSSATSAAASPASPAARPAAPGPASKVASIDDVYMYRVAPSDQNLRLLIDRWARAVGWTAVWDVERDIPVGNGGGKANDWKSAVRWVLSSTELSDVVVKPCFYSNSVVRVVRKTVKCNPNE